MAALQRAMAEALFRPLTPRWGMQKEWADGRPSAEAAAEFIKPNDRLTAFERLEIYNRQYWFRLIDCLYDDYPGLRAVVGERKFLALCRAYLAAHPSESFTLRNLGSRLEAFLVQHPELIAPRGAAALEMVRFEWAQIVAFDEGSKPAVTADDLLDQPPDRLRLALQPYLTLLPLEYAVDDFLMAVKKRDSDVLRGEASNAVAAAPTVRPRRARVAPPRREKVLLAVHRFDNQLYYKRLDPEAFAILQAIAAGQTVADACEVAILASARSLDWATQIKEWFAVWMQLGWFCRCA